MSDLQQPTLREAAAAFGIDDDFDKTLRDDKLAFFEDADPFNDGIQLEGAICRIEDQRYGALFIRRVNGKYKPQLIYCTPKIGYPFLPGTGGARVYRFPEVTKVAFYEKVDGTNIFAFRYTDGRERFVSYKTRLQPLLKASKWGDWLKLWRSMLEKYPAISSLPERNGCGISFELYGNANAHLVSYEVALDCKALFGVNDRGDVIPLSRLQLDGVPVAKLEAEAGQRDEARRVYEQLREKMYNLNRAAGKFVSEGLVVYCHSIDGAVIPFKLKPEDVEEIHWMPSAISREIVQQACAKVIENGFELSVDAVRRILEEDWKPEQVDIATAAGLLRQVIADLEKQQAFREEVLARYRELGLSLRADKGAVMRALSQGFERAAMGKVYSIIAIEEGIVG